MAAFVTLGEIEHSLLNDPPRRRFVIPNVLPAGPVLLYGASSSGKTGIAIRTAIAVAAGLSWADRSTLSGSVLYVAGEDIEGAKERMVGAALALGLLPSDLPLAVMEAPPKGLTETGARHEVELAAKALAKQTGQQIALIVVDTLAACFGPKNQDDAAAAGEYMLNSDRTARALGCSVMSIHHTGKNASAGMRGSKVFFDRADAVLRVNRGDGATSFLKVEKLRNEKDGERFAFDIGGMSVPTAGGPISVQSIGSLRALGVEAETVDQGKERQRQTDRDLMLGVLISLAGSEKTTVSAWQEACYARWTTKSAATRRKVFSINRRTLAADGQVRIDGDTVTVTVTGIHPVTPSVTPEPEDVTVTVTDPPSIEGGDGAGRTGQEKDSIPGNDTVRGDGSKRPKVADPRSKDLGRGAGGEAPAETLRAGDGDADVRRIDDAA